MRLFGLAATVSLLPVLFSVASPGDFQTDTVTTSQGNLEIILIGHGTLMFRFGGKVIHVDPVGRYADYSQMPKADMILVTHEHRDHLDKQAIDRIIKEDTVLALTAACAERIDRGVFTDVTLAAGLVDVDMSGGVTASDALAVLVRAVGGGNVLECVACS